MIKGAENGDMFVVKEYKEDEMDDIITQFIASL